jgi:hypothetical protein
MKKNNSQQTTRVLVAYFALGAIEGLICLWLLLRLPADQKSAIFLGYSPLRMVLITATLIGIIIFLWLIDKAKNQNWQNKFLSWVDRLFQNEKTSTLTVGFLLIVFIIGLIFLYSSITQTEYYIRAHLIQPIELIRTVMDRLAPGVFWISAFCFQTLVLFSILKYSTKADYYRVVRAISIVIFPLLLAYFLLIIQIDSKYYRFINNEDNLVEWLTFACLLISGLLSLIMAYQTYKYGDRYLWFFLLFGVACIILGFEEISWGQRILQVESPNFFLENSDQQEINIHNVVNQWFDVRTKHVAAFVLFIYGVCLPILAIHPKMKTFFEKFRIVISPLFLAGGFALGAFMTLNIFSGQEEEVAELFLSLSLLLFIILETLKLSALSNTIEGH